MYLKGFQLLIGRRGVGCGERIEGVFSEVIPSKPLWWGKHNRMALWGSLPYL